MKITLKNMIFYGYHGIHKEERTLGQRFAIDITVENSSISDKNIKKLEDTIDYTKIFYSIKKIVEGYKFHLLELLCNKILDAIFCDFPLVERCNIKIRKVAVPIDGQLDYVQVEMDRKRDEL